MNKLPHILICDDDPVVHESLGLYLSYEGYPTPRHMTARTRSSISKAIIPT